MYHLRKHFRTLFIVAPSPASPGRGAVPLDGGVALLPPLILLLGRALLRRRVQRLVVGPVPHRGEVVHDCGALFCFVVWILSSVDRCL